MGVERALVSKVIIVLVAMWSPVDFYVFTEPRFETRQACVEYVMENQLSLQLYLSQQYTKPAMENCTFYCVDSESLKNEFDRQNKPQI